MGHFFDDHWGNDGLACLGENSRDFALGILRALIPSLNYLRAARMNQTTRLSRGLLHLDFD